MFKLLCKNTISALLALLTLNVMNSSLMAQECCSSNCNRVYIGGFGGASFSDSSKLTQTGTAFFTEAEGGPLAVNAQGRSDTHSTGFGGVQIGYEWYQNARSGCSNWGLTSAVEAEAYFYGYTKKGHLINSSDRLPEHDFVVSLPMNMGLYLVNGVFTLNHGRFGKFSPYVGGGIGVAHISIAKADSLQESPSEPGINHFNSDTSDSSWAFAAQAKAGIRYNICERFHIFGECRFSYVDSSRYNFGSTAYPTHAATSPWNVEVKSICNNAFAFGLQFDLN